MSYSYFTIALNAAVCALILRSAAKCSILDAPKNPSMPFVFLITYPATVKRIILLLALGVHENFYRELKIRLSH